MRAIRIHETGGPEVMHLEEIETPTAKAGEILIVEISRSKYIPN
jgi:NADPH:quinone reductase